jgi:hypothetical protein
MLLMLAENRTGFLKMDKASVYVVAGLLLCLASAGVSGKRKHTKSP